MDDSKLKIEMQKLLDLENRLFKKQVLISKTLRKNRIKNIANANELDAKDLKILKLRREHRAKYMKLGELKRDLATANVQYLQERKAFSAKGILERFERKMKHRVDKSRTQYQRWKYSAITKEAQNLPKELKFHNATEFGDTAMGLIEKLDELQSSCVCEQTRIKDLHLTDAQLKLLAALYQLRCEQSAKDMQALDLGCKICKPAITNNQSLKEMTPFRAKEILLHKLSTLPGKHMSDQWDKYAKSKEGKNLRKKNGFRDAYQFGCDAQVLFDKVIHFKFSCICEHIRMKNARLTDEELKLMEAVCLLFPLPRAILWQI